jgi:hypothetical protein
MIGGVQWEIRKNTEGLTGHFDISIFFDLIIDIQKNDGQLQNRVVVVVVQEFVLVILIFW